MSKWLQVTAICYIWLSLQMSGGSASGAMPPVDNSKGIVKKRIGKHKCKHPGCKRAPFHAPGELQHHVDFTHKGINHFVCDHITDEKKGTKCGKVFELRKSLTAHEKTHIEGGLKKRIGTHKCPYPDCKSAPFQCVSLLQLHKDFSHLGINHFVCDHIIDDKKGTKCGEACVSRFKLDEHKKRNHSGVKECECEEYDCDAKFVTNYEYRNHWVRAHSPADDPRRTKHTCTSCTAGFVSSSDLEEHRVRNHLAKDDPKLLALHEHNNTYWKVRFANDDQLRLNANASSLNCYHKQKEGPSDKYEQFILKKKESGRLYREKKKEELEMHRDLVEVDEDEYMGTKQFFEHDVMW
jgi:hypothetical protein